MNLLSVTKGKVNITLFPKDFDTYIIIIQIYVVDMIFCATNKIFCKQFTKLMQDEFKMSIVLIFFLRL